MKRIVFNSQHSYSVAVMNHPLVSEIFYKLQQVTQGFTIKENEGSECAQSQKWEAGQSLRHFRPKESDSKQRPEATITWSHILTTKGVLAGKPQG